MNQNICEHYQYLPSNMFTWENYGGKDWQLPIVNLQLNQVKNGVFYTLEHEWKIIGWTYCKNLQIRPRKEGIAVMLITPNNDSVWFHWVGENEVILDY